LDNENDDLAAYVGLSTEETGELVAGILSELGGKQSNLDKSVEISDNIASYAASDVAKMLDDPDQWWLFLVAGDSECVISKDCEGSEREKEESDGVALVLYQVLTYHHRHCFYSSLVEAHNARIPHADRNKGNTSFLTGQQILRKRTANAIRKISISDDLFRSLYIYADAARNLKDALDNNSRRKAHHYAPRTLEEHATAIENTALWGSASIDGILLTPFLGPILVYEPILKTLHLYENVTAHGLYVPSRNRGVVFANNYESKDATNDKKMILLSYKGYDNFNWCSPQKEGRVFMLSADRNRFYIARQ
jgi:hypothetical protein